MLRYRMVKVIKITDEEIDNIRGKDASYINENYDGTCIIAIDTCRDSLKKYVDLSKYLYATELKYDGIDFNAIREEFKIPSEYESPSIARFDKYSILSFKSMNGIRRVVELTNKEIDEKYTVSESRLSWVAHVEPIYELPEKVGFHLAKTFGMFNDNGSLIKKYTRISPNYFLSKYPEIAKDMGYECLKYGIDFSIMLEVQTIC